MYNLSDTNFIFALPVERILHNPQEFKRKVTDGWQLVLAEARKRFLIDELIRKNNLQTKDLNGEILELDGGISKLSIVLRRNGARSHQVSLYDVVNDASVKGIFGIGVSHNQLEHYPSMDFVEHALSFIASRSAYGMIHQVHAVDDPAFEWDKSHSLRMTSSEWEEYFKDWAQRNGDNGWNYIGSHRGASGRPKNFVLEKNGSLPFYIYYDSQAIRRIVAELTLANGISASRVPLVLLSFSIANENPYLLSGLIGAIHALDALDGYVARKGFCNSSYGPMTDVFSDHVVEAMIMLEYAYDKNWIPKEVPWILIARNISTDILRLYNAFKVGTETSSSHPHEAFGTVGKEGRRTRLLYGLIKAVGDMTIPIVPKLGLYVSAVHVGASIRRALPVWTSPKAQEIYKEVLTVLIKKIRRE